MFRPGNLGHLGRLGLVAASRPSLVAQALAILAKYGSAANLYLPGVGAISGIQAGNWLNSVGLISAAADGQVGLVVSAGKAVGPELVPATAVTSLAGWTTNGCTLAIVNGVLELTATRTGVTFADISLVSSGALGKSYIFGFKGGLGQLGGLFYIGLTGATVPYTPLDADFFWVADAVSIGLRARLDATEIGQKAYFSQITVRELPGAHLTQSTAANRPALRRGLVNRMLWGGDFTNAAWGKSGSAAATNPATISMPTTPSSVAEFLTIEASVGTTATFACLLSGTGTITLGLARNGPGAYEDTLVKVTLPATPELFLVTHTIRNAGQTGFIAFISRQTGDTAASVSCPGAALFIGAVTAQQIIDAGGIPITTTAPASSTNGPFAWQLDGSNDSFSSTLTPGNAGFFCSGAQVNDSGVLRTLLGAGAGSDASSGVWLARAASNALTLQVGNGTTRNSIGAAYPVATNAVASAGWDASAMFVGINNTETSGAKTVNCTSSNTMNLGVLTGTTNPMLGTISGGAIIMPTVLPTASERATLRQFIASLSGVTI